MADDTPVVSRHGKLPIYLVGAFGPLRWSIFRKSDHRFSEENATKSTKPERFPIQRNREAR
jgi:hypothetical protein